MGNHQLTPVSVRGEVQAPNYQANTQTSPTVSSSNKRVRMDPDTRAALIQRVPKAVKRTTCILSQQMYIPQQSTTTPIKSPATTNGKVQKAVKHTMPRHLLKQKATEESSGPKQQQKSANKQSSSNNTNIYLKDILPPPIMQSTKRPNNVHSHSVNKAIKHTGGGSNAYYQSLNHGSNNSTDSLSKVKPFAQLNVNSLNDTTGKSHNANSGKIPYHQANPNKINMTTTYVYKRVSHQPDIDLNLGKI